MSMNFKVSQIDVKNAFLKGYKVEEVYFEKPSGFEDKIFLNHFTD